MAGDESGRGPRRSEGDDSSNSGAFGAGVEDGSEGAFARIEGFDSAGIDVDRALGEKEPRTSFR